MTTTRDRERLDADAMKTQRTDNSAAPVTGASEGGGKVVARQAIRWDRVRTFHPSGGDWQRTGPRSH